MRSTKLPPVEPAGSGRGLVWLAVLVVACGGVQARSPIHMDDVSASLGRIEGTACLKPILATAAIVEVGRMLTVAHAIAGAGDDLRVVTLDGVEHELIVIGFDPVRDLALLEVDGLQGPSLAFGSVASGDAGVITAVTGDLEIDHIPYRVTRVVTARSGDIYNQGDVQRQALDLEAEVGPGDSGAPLLDPSGEIVGVLFADTTGVEGSAWALHPAEIESFLATVTGDGEVDRGRCR